MATDKKGSSGGASGSTGRRKQSIQDTTPAIDPFEGQTFNEIDWFDATPYLNAAFEEQNATQEQQDAIAVYKGSDYYKINMALRQPDKWKAYIQKLGYSNLVYAENIQNTIEDAIKGMRETKGYNLPSNTVLHRGFELPENHELRNTLFKGYQDGSLIGQSFSDPGYSSTTIDKNKKFSGNVQLKINALKGTNVIVPSTKGENGSEQEILLRPGARFRIRSATVNGENMSLEVDLVD